MIEDRPRRGFRFEEEEEEEAPEPRRRRRKRPRSSDREGSPLARIAVPIGAGVTVLLLVVLLLASLSWFRLSYLWLAVAAVVACATWFTCLKLKGDLEMEDVAKWALGIGAGMFLLSWGLTYLIVRSNRDNYLAKAGLDKKEDDFAQSGQRRRMGQAVLIGKVVVLEREQSGSNSKFKFDTMQFKLDEDLMPEDEEEVGTVVLVDYSQRQVGKYDNGADAMRWFVNLQLIDYQNRAFFFQRSFAGSKPPETTKSSSSDSGSKPYGEMVDWLNGLPRQKLGTEPPAGSGGGQPGPGGPGGGTKPLAPLKDPKTPPPASKFNGLIAYWPMDEGNGAVVKDQSANALNARLVGGQWTQGIREKALQLNGASDYLDLGQSPVLNVATNAPFTIAGWVKTKETTGTILAFRDQPNRFNLRAQGAVLHVWVKDGRLIGWMRQDGGLLHPAEGKSAYNVNDGKWHHFAMVRDQFGRLDWYVDGRSIGGMKNLSGQTNPSGPVTTTLRAIGLEPFWQQKNVKSADERFLAGSVDEFCVFNRGLAAAEVTELAGRAP